MSEHICEFITTADHFLFSTRVNGDRIVLENLALNQEQATALAHLINTGSGAELHVEIKLVE
jgi:hypothetical protein